MAEFTSTDELREFILNRQDLDEDVIGYASHCWGLSWKKDRWVIKFNNKKVAEITDADVPKDFDFRKPEFSFEVLSALRNISARLKKEFRLANKRENISELIEESINGLNLYLKELE